MASEYKMTYHEVGQQPLSHRLSLSLFMALAHNYRFSLDCSVITKPNSRILFSFANIALKLTYGHEEFKNCNEGGFGVSDYSTRMWKYK